MLNRRFYKRNSDPVFIAKISFGQKIGKSWNDNQDNFKHNNMFISRNDYGVVCQLEMVSWQEGKGQVYTLNNEITFSIQRSICFNYHGTCIQMLEEFGFLKI